MADEEGGASERVSIRQSAKFHKKYGSTTTNNHMKTPRCNSGDGDACVKHTVSETDTLQGIALKYGVTMEQIRRANKIWANDSLFLRNTLDIPIKKMSSECVRWEDTNGSGSIGNVPSSSSRDNGSRASAATATGINPIANGQSQPEPQQLQRRNSAPDCSSSADQTISDLLIRIDSSIAQTRSQVERREKLQEFSSEDGLYNPSSRSNQNHYLHHHHHHHHHHHLSRVRQSRNNLLSDHTDPHATMTVQPSVGAMTQGRKVDSSLQRLQREQDEMFEL